MGAFWIAILWISLWGVSIALLCLLCNWPTGRSDQRRIRAWLLFFAGLFALLLCVSLLQMTVSVRQTWPSREFCYVHESDMQHAWCRNQTFLKSDAVD